MATSKDLLIPYDENLPVEEFDSDEDRWTDLAVKITGRRDGMLDARTFPTRHTQLFYDDLGLYDQPNNTNPRAMKLWAHLCGINLDQFHQNLVGNFVVLGIDELGEAVDVTADVRYFFGEEGVTQA